MNPIQAKNRAAYAMSSMGRAQSATRLMLAAWSEAAEALSDGGRGATADLEAMARLREAEKVAEAVADGPSDGPGARLVAQGGAIAGRRQPFTIR